MGLWGYEISPTRSMKPQITQMSADLQTPPPTRRAIVELATTSLHSCVQWRPGMQAGRPHHNYRAFGSITRHPRPPLPGALPEVTRGLPMSVPGTAADVSTS